MSNISAVDRWKSMVEKEHAQTAKVRDLSPTKPDDWQHSSEYFREDPCRKGDPLVDRLTREVALHHTVIDVGAGAGRLSLPLALQCRHVTAVEPSPSMASIFIDQVEIHRISAVRLVQTRWEDSQIDPADFVLCSHVLYTVTDVEGFLRKLESHARKRVWIVLFRDPPQQSSRVLWRHVHKEKRLQLPSLPQFQQVLRELNIHALQEELPPLNHKSFRNLDDAWEKLRIRLFLTQGSPKDQILQKILPQELQKIEDGLQLRGTMPHQPVLISWSPSINSGPDPNYWVLK